MALLIHAGILVDDRVARDHHVHALLRLGILDLKVAVLLDLLVGLGEVRNLAARTLGGAASVLVFVLALEGVDFIREDVRELLKDLHEAHDILLL